MSSPRETGHIRSPRHVPPPRLEQDQGCPSALSGNYADGVRQRLAFRRSLSFAEEHELRSTARTRLAKPGGWSIRDAYVDNPHGRRAHAFAPEIEGVLAKLIVDQYASSQKVMEY
jgi:hypothetical protein